MVTELIIAPEIKEIKNDGRTGIFEIEPLSPGYGLTIGNALRRVLLSSLEGASVYALKIEGYTHEFSTIKGIKEDLISIILNIKCLNITLFGDEKATLKLKAKGPKKVTAADIEVPSGCEIKNKDQEIATLGKGAKLNIEFYVDRGMGYLTSEKKKEQSTGELGLIFIDAIYTPIEKVNFKVENIRVGQATNYNKLYLEVYTNGTTDPAKAIKDSARILCNQFDTVSSLALKEETVKPKIKKATKAKAEKKEIKPKTATKSKAAPKTKIKKK